MVRGRFLIIDDLYQTGIRGPASELAKQYACALYYTDNFKDPRLPTVQSPRRGQNRTKSRKRSHDRYRAPRSRTSNRSHHRSSSFSSDENDKDIYHPSRHNIVHKTPSIDSSTDSQTSSTHNAVPQTPLPDSTSHRAVLEALMYELFKANERSGITSPNVHQSELLMSLKTHIEQMIVLQQTQDDRNVESPVKPPIEIQTPNELSAEKLDSGTDCYRSEQTVLFEQLVTDNTTQNVTQEDQLDVPMHHVVVESSADSKEEINDTETQHSDGTSNQEKSEFGAETIDQALSESQVQECMDVTEPQNTVEPGVVDETATVHMETDDKTLASSFSELNDCQDPAVVSEPISTEQNLVEMETNNSENGFVEKPVEATVNSVVENVSEQSAIDEDEVNYVPSSREDSEVKQPEDCPTQVTQLFVDVNIAQTMASLPQQSEFTKKDDEVIAQVNDTTETRAESSTVPIRVTPPTPTVSIAGVTPALQQLQIGQAVSQDTETRNNLQLISWNQAAPGLPESNASRLLQKRKDQVAQPNVPEFLNHPNTSTLPVSKLYLKDTPHGKVIINENNIRMGLYPVHLPCRTDSSPVNPVISSSAPNPSPPHTFSPLSVSVAPPNQPILRQEGPIQFPQNLIHQPTLNQFLQHQQNMINAQLRMHHQPMFAQHPPNGMNWNMIEATQSMNAYLSSPMSQRVGGQNPNQLLPSPLLTFPSQPFGSQVNSNTSLVHQKIPARVLKTSDNDPSKESGYTPPTSSTAAPPHVSPATGTIPTVTPTDIQSPIGNAAMEPSKRKQPEIEYHPVFNSAQCRMINFGADISDEELKRRQNEAIRDNLPPCPPGIYQLGRPFRSGLVRFYRKDSFERGVELVLPTQLDDERKYRQLYTEGRVVLPNLSHQPGWKFGQKGIHPSIREKMKQPNRQPVTAMHPKLQHHGVQNLHPRRRQNESVQKVQQDDNEQHKAKVARLKQNMGPITENGVAVFNTPRTFPGQITERRQVIGVPSNETALQKKEKPFTRISDYQDRRNPQVEFIDLTGDEEEETTVGIDATLQNISISSDCQNPVGKVNLETGEPRQLQQNVSEQKDKSMRVEQSEAFNHHHPKQFFPPDYKKYDVTKTPRARVLKITPTNPYPLIHPVRRTKQKHTKIQLERLQEIYEMYKQHKIVEYDYAKLGQPISLAAFQVKQYINNQKAADRRKERKTQKVEESKNSYGFNDDNQQ
ncbi:hypothetical protein GCK72_005208 [Caenorhabditis remanei]|uniref:Uncharacterized protein n=1 Tax=Caenorhabditis remanei TaxID=31234 RepID=A0A6A5HEN1_CAERE|nr:hypothetical protein GCK72_005208 [Caenorhabditis remanei]KAF1765256.1 hypothetical protein GCK72_005208 [Caenorhabditis remanei]